MRRNQFILTGTTALTMGSVPIGSHAGTVEETHVAGSPAQTPQVSQQPKTTDFEYKKFDDFISFLRARNEKQYAVPPPNGIYEEQYVRIGGIDQWVTIHGSDRDNPVLLFLHGGPGDCTNPWTYVLFAPWQKHFTVVQWDQRGAGKTLRKSGPSVLPTVAVERMVQDGIELSDYLRTHLRKRKIIIVGHSFGTILGLTMARTSPDKYYAYVGTGQVVDGTTGYSVAYDALLKYAHAIGNHEAIDELTRVGPPPYASGAGFGVQRKWSNAFEGADKFLPGTIGLRLVGPGGGVQAVNDDADSEIFSGQKLVPETTKFRAKASLGTNFGVPMFGIQGERDFTTPTSMARGYFESIEAPRKEFVTIPDAGHFAVFIHSDEFLRSLVNLVAPLTVASHFTAPP